MRDMYICALCVVQALTAVRLRGLDLEALASKEGLPEPLWRC